MKPFEGFFNPRSGRHPQPLQGSSTTWMV